MNLFNDRILDYSGKEGLEISVRPAPTYPWTHIGAIFTISKNGKKIELPLWYAHASLVALLLNDFDSVLDLGSNEGLASQIFSFLGKKVTALEPIEAPVASLPEIKIYPPDINRDFLDVNFDKKFDAIWCSHVLEHTRNPGAFLDKIFADLYEGGILALTVPFHDLGGDIFSFALGHHNHYNVALLIYQLICAGFDCRNVSIGIYCNQIGIILKKKSNNLPKISAGLVNSEKTWMGSIGDLTQFFPFPLSGDSGRFDQVALNWTYPT